MDVHHEINLSDYLDYIESAESKFVTSAPVVPPWERKQHWSLWSPFLREYHNVIDNPKKLPTILQPLISKERAFTFGQDYPSYFNFKLHVTDEYGVHRRLYMTLCQENLIVGSVGAVLVGVGTKHFNLSQSRIDSFVAQRFLLGKPVAAITRMALSASILTGSLFGKLVLRAVTGGILYDLLKRSREEKHMDKTKTLMNVGLVGGFCGFLFGIRGGLPHAWAAAFLTSAGAVASEYITIPQIFSTQQQETAL